MRELSIHELESSNGGFLVNIGMGMAGLTGGLALYSLNGGIRGQMSGSGFIGAGIAGFVYGLSGFNPAGALAGAAMGGAAQAALDEDDS